MVTYFARLIHSYQVPGMIVSMTKRLTLPVGTLVRVDESENGRRSYMYFYNPLDEMVWTDDVVPFSAIEELENKVMETNESIDGVLKRVNYRN